MPPALQAVLTSSGLTLGLQSSIRPLTRSVTAGPGGIRGSAPHHGIELWRSYIASGLADPGCPVSPSLHHHPRTARWMPSDQHEIWRTRYTFSPVVVNVT